MPLKTSGNLCATKQESYLWKYLIDCLTIQQVTLVEGNRLSRNLLHSGQCTWPAIGEVVNGNDLVALIQQVNDAMGTNVASPSSYKHCSSACHFCIEKINHICIYAVEEKKKRQDHHTQTMLTSVNDKSADFKPTKDFKIIKLMPSKVWGQSPPCTPCLCWGTMRRDSNLRT